jgi:hypothetical protein
VLSFCLGAFDLQSTKMCEIMKVTNGRLIIGAWGRRLWANAALMNMHLGRQIGFVARGKRSGDRGTNSGDVREMGAKCSFYMLCSRSIPLYFKIFFGLITPHRNTRASTRHLHISVNIGATNTVQRANLLRIVCTIGSARQNR